MKVYEICESSVYDKGCTAYEHYTCKFCSPPIWEEHLGYENLKYIGKNIFFTKEDAENRLKKLKELKELR